MQRAQGEIYVEPCDGVELEPGSLVRLLVNVYGLDDALMAWGRTVVRYLESHGFVRYLLEPCWWMRCDSRGRLLNVMSFEVDDFLIGSSSPESRQWLRG
eukprot:1900861-Pyramimonas_sp.AAC.1